MERVSYFSENVEDSWDGRLYCRTVPNQPNHRQLTKPLPCGDGFIPVGFIWNGSSSGILRGVFPKWRHPIASCRHDWRCGLAKNDDDRKFADKEFKKDVAKTSWKATALIGYAGVRIGAFFGIGSDYEQ